MTEETKERRRINAKKRYHNDIEKYKKSSKIWRDDNREKIKDYTKKYYDNHREEQLEKHRIFRINNIDEYRKRDRDYGKTLRGRYKGE